MTPLLIGSALTACYALGAWGFVLVRDRGPATRFAGPVAGPQPEESEGRRGLVSRFYDYLADRLAPRATGMLSERQREKIRARLDNAGKPNGMTIEGYAGRKAAYTVVIGGAGLLLLIQGQLLLGALMMFMGWIWMDMWLARVARLRQAQIERDLPDFLDILAVTVSAGVGFRQALARVGEALGGPLAEEILTALRQMDLGYGRRDALEGIKKRNSCEPLNDFVTALLQAEELGVPLAAALGNLAEDMRRSFYQAVRRRAARAAPRVSLIVSTLIVPGAIILIVASVIVNADFSPQDVLGG